LRCLSRENDLYIPARRYCEYRWINESQFGEALLYIYGDKTGFIQFKRNDVVVTLVENAAVADSMRKIFNAIWVTAKKLPPDKSRLS
jgi:hypothetical protein